MGEVTLKIFVDPKEPASQAVTKELVRQLQALDVGDVKEKKAPPPPGTLAVPDPDTILIILKIAFWSFKAGKAIIEVIRESRERTAAEKQVDEKRLPKVFVAVNDKESVSTAVPGSKKEEDEFLDKIEERVK